MPFIDYGMPDVGEPEAVAEGEYDLTITKAEDTISKKGNPMTVITLRIDGEPDADIVRHWMVHPTKDTPDDQKVMRAREAERFLQCFNVPHDPGPQFDTSDLSGCSGRCFLTQEEDDEGNNVYNRLRLPRMKTSGSS